MTFATNRGYIPEVAETQQDHQHFSETPFQGPRAINPGMLPMSQDQIPRVSMQNISQGAQIQGVVQSQSPHFLPMQSQYHLASASACSMTPSSSSMAASQPHVMPPQQHQLNLSSRLESDLSSLNRQTLVYLQEKTGLVPKHPASMTL